MEMDEKDFAAFKLEFHKMTNSQSNTGCPMHAADPNNTEFLSEDRVSSSIPMADGKVWMYPSEQVTDPDQCIQQMFYKAMKNKNKNPNEKDMG